MNAANRPAGVTPHHTPGRPASVMSEPTLPYAAAGPDARPAPRTYPAALAVAALTAHAAALAYIALGYDGPLGISCSKP